MFVIGQNTRDKTVSVLVWNVEDQENIVKLISKLKENGYYKKDSEKSVNSRYLDRSERTSLYQGWIQNRNKLSEMVGSKDEFGKQHRRLEREYSNVNRQDLFLANLERKLRRGDGKEFEAMKRSFYNSISSFEEQMEVLRR